MNFRNKAVSIYLVLMIFNFILANSAKWGERLDVTIYFKTYKLTLKRKKAKPRVNAKKVTTRLLVNLPCLSETWERKRCFKPWNSKIVSQNSRLATIPTFNMIKGYRYDTGEKYLELHQKSVNPKNYRYLFTYLENRPKSRLPCDV